MILPQLESRRRGYQDTVLFLTGCGTGLLSSLLCCLSKCPAVVTIPPQPQAAQVGWTPGQVASCLTCLSPPRLPLLDPVLVCLRTTAVVRAWLDKLLLLFPYRRSFLAGAACVHRIRDVTSTQEPLRPTTGVSFLNRANLFYWKAPLR